MKRKIPALAVVSLKTALKYRRDWNKNSAAVKRLQKLMPRASNKGFRVYMPIGGTGVKVSPVVPLAVRHALRQAGFRVADYLAKKCVKIKDKEQKNFFNIGKVISKDAVAKAAFDNDKQLQNSNSAGFQVVISCHPYDIIGMSTGRDWDDTSCMRLADGRKGVVDGAYKRHLKNDIAEGTLVAYAIRTGDDNLKQPLCRCLLKPFINSEDDVLYRRESSIYGSVVPGFEDTVNKFMRKINMDAPSGRYSMSDELYDDGVGEDHDHVKDAKVKNVDWAKLESPTDTFFNEPTLFPSYVAFSIAEQTRIDKKPLSPNDAARARQSRTRKGTGVGPRSAWAKLAFRTMSLGTDMSTQILKQTARVIALSPAAIAGFREEMLGMKNANAVRPYFLNKEFRAAMNASVKADPIDFDKLSPAIQKTMTYASLGFQHAYANKLDTIVSCAGAAMDYLEGRLKLNKADILKNPNLHNCVWFMANLERERSAYQDSYHDRQLHKILSIIPKPDDVGIATKRIIYSEIRENGDFLNLFVWAMQAAKNDPDMFEIISGGWKDSLDIVLSNRRLRREMFKLADQRPQLADQLSLEIGQQFLQDNINGAEAQKEAKGFVERHGLNAPTFNSYRRIMSAMPEMFQYIYWGSIKLNNQDDLDDILSYGVNAVIRNWAKAAADGKTYTAINPAQQKMFDLVGALLTIQRPPVVAPFEFDGENILHMLKQSRFLLTAGADFHDYPNLLDTNAVEEIKPIDFVRDDNGEKSLKIFAKRARKFDGLDTFLEWVGTVLENSTSMRQLGGAMGLGAVRLVRRALGQLAQGSDAQTLTKHFKDAVAYMTKLMEFFITVPNAHAPNFDTQAVKWLAKYGFSQAQFEDSYGSVQNLCSDMAEYVQNVKENTSSLSAAFLEAFPNLSDTFEEIQAPLVAQVKQWKLLSQMDDDEVYGEEVETVPPHHRHRARRQAPPATLEKYAGDEEEDDEEPDDEEEFDEDDDEKGVYQEPEADEDDTF